MRMVVIPDLPHDGSDPSSPAASDGFLFPLEAAW